MRTTLFLGLLISAAFLLSPAGSNAQSTTGGKPKNVLNKPVKGGSKAKSHKKTKNISKKSVHRKPMSLMTAPAPEGAKEKKQNKTINRPKKYIRV
jgi:hypothetical protein